MNIGYMRISTSNQNLSLQKDSLNKMGCEKIYQDVISGSKEKRAGLDECLNQLRKGDTLVVWRLDRLGRSLKHLINLINGFEKKGIYFKSITESIDTATAGGKLIFHIFGSLAEFERNLIRERTLAGLESARKQGKFGGRPKTKDYDKKVKMAKALYKDKSNKTKDICETLGVSKMTFYRMLKVV